MNRARRDHLVKFFERTEMGSIYVVRFSTGLLKVGLAAYGEKRVKQHVDAAVRQGNSVVDVWISPRHKTFKVNEQALIDFCRAQYGDPAHGNETFAAASFADVVSYAQTLQFDQLTDDDMQALLDRHAAADESARANVLNRQLGALADEVMLINSLANDQNEWATTEANFSVATRLVEIIASPWSQTDPDAIVRYIEGRFSVPVSDRNNARNLENEMRAVFVMEHKRHPDSFDEFATYMDTAFRRIGVLPGNSGADEGGAR